MKGPESNVVEVIHINCTKTVPNIPNKKLVIDIGTNHPGTIRVEVAIEKGDGGDIGKMPRVRQFDVPRSVLFGHHVS